MMSVNNLLLPNHNLTDYLKEYNTSDSSTLFPLIECKYTDLNLLNTNTFNDCNIMNLNIRSLPCKFTEFEAFSDLLTPKPDFISLTETWLNSSNSCLFQLNNYESFNNYRSHKRGGGVSIYVLNSYQVKLYEEFSYMNEHIESLVIECCNKGVSYCKSYFVCCIYRPPAGDQSIFLSNMNNILEFISARKLDQCFVCGDFNIDLIRINTCTASKELLNLFLSFSFFPCVYVPTRSAGSSNSLIDNIFVNNSKYSMKSFVLYYDISDHYPVFLTMAASSCTETHDYGFSVKCRNFANKNKIKFFRLLNNVNCWSELSGLNMQNADFNYIFQKFYCTYLNCFNLSFPYKSCSNALDEKGNHKPWLTSSLLTMVKTKSVLYKRYKRNPTIVNKMAFNTFRNRLCWLLKQAKCQYYKNMFSDCNNKNFWSKVNKFFGKRSNSVNDRSSFICNGKYITNENEIANCFNDFFVNEPVNICKNLPVVDKDKFKDYLNERIPTSFALFPTTVSEILNISKNLHKTWSTDIDGIPMHIFIESVQYVVQPLVMIINVSFEKGIFPDLLKIAKVLPLFKKGNHEQIINYRPISLLPCFSKIFEKLMYIRLVNYFENKGLITGSQFGFRAKNCTINAVIKLTDYVTNSIDNNEECIAVFIDFCKAFDSVQSEILLYKLANYGIRGTALAWLSSYLTNRKQKVNYRTTLSADLQVLQGVPQGSILGPLLFIIYINDLINCSKLLYPILFADDSNMLYSNKSRDKLFSVVNTELEKLHSWCLCNRLSINFTKTVYLLFTLKSVPVENHFTISINSLSIQNVKFTKFLGVYIDCQLSWSIHIDELCTRLSIACGILFRLRPYLSLKQLLSLYNTIVFTHLNYGIVLWGTASSSFVNKLFIVQKRIIRTITFSTQRSHSLRLFKKLHILTINDLYNFNVCVLTFKILHNLTSLNSALISLESNQYYSLRVANNVNLKVQPCRTVFRKNSVFFKCISIWNSLSSSMRTLHFLNQFKNSLKTEYLTSYI